jgi:thioredoxin reductase
MTHDVIVIGGSYAGMSAAMQLARARRAVLVVDAGERRNRSARAAHGFLTQDGRAPAEIAAGARAQLLAYPTVEWRDGRVEVAEAVDGGFRVATAGGAEARARRVIVATGVVDQLPAIPGLAERWGRSVFHCPYCHGYELGGGAVGVLAVSPDSMHHALMLPDWGPTTLLLNGAFTPDAAQRAELERRGVAVEHGLVDRLEGERADVVLRDGRVVRLDGVFTMTRVGVAGPVAGQLGCALDEGVHGAVIRVDPMKATSVPGVFACGDAARPFGSLALAVADGALAGTTAHRSLVFGL